MIVYRGFRNSDPPALCDVWRSEPPLHRLAQPITTAHWEQYIFSKTYFDPAGLILAVDGARVVGFVHAGFSPTASGEGLDYSSGVISRLFVVPHANRGAMMAELLAAAEDYLTRRGAKEAIVGNTDPYGPFYLGLYGSSRLPGLLRSDAAQIRYFTEAAYGPIGERIIMQRLLSGFRSPVDRDQVRHRKLHEVQVNHDPLPKSWWEACATSHLERISFDLLPKIGGPLVATAMTALIPALSEGWGVRAAGFEDVGALSDAWQNGTALMLVADVLKTMQQQGVALMEAVLDDSDSPLGRVLTCAGFGEVDRGVVLRKSLVSC